MANGGSAWPEYMRNRSRAKQVIEERDGPIYNGAIYNCTNCYYGAGILVNRVAENWKLGFEYPIEITRFDHYYGVPETTTETMVQMSNVVNVYTRRDEGSLHTADTENYRLYCCFCDEVVGTVIVSDLQGARNVSFFLSKSRALKGTRRNGMRGLARQLNGEN